MTLEQITWRIGELQNRLLVLRDNHRHLSARLSDLRNRLR
jgi:chaperonin cofactor prefoldin